MLRQFFLVLVFLICVSVSISFFQEPAHAQTPAQETVPKNIILVIGDGMGLSAISGAHITQGKLNLEEFTEVGLLFTHAVDGLVNASPGATTALAAGVLTRKDLISLDSKGDPVKTVLEYAQEKGMGTGLVVTSSVTDATPACFVSHVSSRHLQNNIAADLAVKNVDVMIGGGLAYFQPSSTPGSLRHDNLDLLDLLSKTHTVVTSPQQFNDLGQPNKLAAFLDKNDLPTADLRPVSLSSMVRKALEILGTREKGFFLMVEGSQIDWAAHHGYGEHLIRETVDLDNAVGVALEFAKKHGDTLIVVTADHDSGGMAIVDGSWDNHKITNMVFLTDKHTASMVPIFAYGPGGEVFDGIHPMTFVGQTLIEYVNKK